MSAEAKKLIRDAERKPPKAERSNARRVRKPKPPSRAAWLGLRREAHVAVDKLPPDARIATIEVDDPYSTAGEVERIVVARYINHDPLAWLHSHKQVDDAQYLAGRKWQSLHQQTSIGSVGSVDTTREPVDGGRWPDLFSDNRAMASLTLARLRKLLREPKASLVEDVLGREISLREAVSLREGGQVTRLKSQAWAKLFYQSLEILAVEFGYAMGLKSAQGP